MTSLPYTGLKMVRSPARLKGLTERYNIEVRGGGIFQHRRLVLKGVAGPLAGDECRLFGSTDQYLGRPGGKFVREGVDADRSVAYVFKDVTTDGLLRGAIHDTRFTKLEDRLHRKQGEGPYIASYKTYNMLPSKVDLLPMPTGEMATVAGMEHMYVVDVFVHGFPTPSTGAAPEVRRMAVRTHGDRDHEMSGVTNGVSGIGLDRKPKVERGSPAPATKDVYVMGNSAGYVEDHEDGDHDQGVKIMTDSIVYWYL